MMLYVVFVCFFISGACGLIYEVVWSRDFIQVLGGTTHAVTAVVVAFMGGLGLGGLVGGKLIDRVRTNPVVVYGLLEGGIAVFALLVPVLVRASHPLMSIAYQSMRGSWGFDLLRFAVSALILFPPTFLMGATLPVLVRATLSERDRFGFTAGRMYAINTVGAMAGAGLAGFVLLPALGNRTTVWIAVGFNLLIFASVLVLRDRFSFPPPASELGAQEEKRPWSAVAILVLLGYGFSGLASLIYQIAWTRSLALTLGGSTYSFSLILVSFIGGLGLGGALITPFVDRIKRPLLWAGGMEFLIGLAAVAVLPVLDNINLAMYQWVFDYSGEGRMLSVVRFLTTFGILFVPTLTMGALLPLVARVIARERPGAGEPMGWVYSANTAGAVVGAFLCGYILLHFLGARSAIMAATMVSLGIGAIWLISSEVKKVFSVPAAALATALAIVPLALLPDPDPLVINAGPSIYAAEVSEKTREIGKISDILRRRWKVVYSGEDEEATVTVMKDRVNEWMVLKINGKADASTSLDMPTQILSAQLPLIFHPRPRSALVIGLASGVSAGSALLHPVDKVTCLEISPAVVEASRYFARASHLDYSDPRFELIIGDGRNHLELSEETYDVIISEPSNPWLAGMGALFTKRYFQLIRDRLNPDGIAMVWLGIYNMDAENLALILRTYIDVFPYVTIWESAPEADYIILGSKSPFRIPYHRIVERTAREEIARDLARVDTDADSIMARFVMDQDMIRDLVGEGPLHTDDLKQLEYELPKELYVPTEQRLEGMFRTIFSHFQDAGTVIELPEGEEGRILESRLREMDRIRKDYVEFLVRSYRLTQNPELLIAEMEKVLARTGGKYPAQNIQKDLATFLVTSSLGLFTEKRMSEALHGFKRAFELDPENSLAATSIARIMYLTGNKQECMRWAYTALQARPRDHVAYSILAVLARDGGDLRAESTYWKEAIEIWPQNAPYRVFLARSLIDRGEIEEAVAQLETALDLQPDDATANLYMGEAMYKAGEWNLALRHLKRAIKLAPRDPARPQAERLIREISSRPR